jgi:deoxyadenosine/deoxycytidine kinase
LGKLITIIGNCGSGKTTLAELLCARSGYSRLLEQHVQRPFQQAFMQDSRSNGFQNQIDYLLLRAEQELDLRRALSDGIVDGGLDQDFYVFTRLFHMKGYLTQPEYQLCQRLYLMLCQFLPPPDLVIRLTAPIAILRERRARRSRPLDIVRDEDLEKIDLLLQDWVQAPVRTAPMFEVDAGDDNHFMQVLVPLAARIQASLAE